MSHSNLSRRSILAGVAVSAPVLALPAVFAASAPVIASDCPLPVTNEVDPVIELAECAMRTHDAFEVANKASCPFDEAMIVWRKKNPQPKSPEDQNFAARLNQVVLDPRIAGSLSEIEQRIIKGYRIPPVDETILREYEIARAKWERRRRYAERRSGYKQAMANVNAASDTAGQAIESLRDTVPLTFDGVAAKARATRYIGDAADEDLSLSIARDIGVLTGEIDREAVQS